MTDQTESAADELDAIAVAEPNFDDLDAGSSPAEIPEMAGSTAAGGNFEPVQAQEPEPEPEEPRSEPRSSRISDPVVDGIRRPPQSIESEQCVLGGILLDNHAFSVVTDIIGADDFYRPDHRIIFEQMAELTKNAKPIDVVTVFEELRARKQDVEVGGLQYLVSLSNATPSAANIRRYAEIVRDRSILRQLVSVGEKIATSALAPQTGEVSDLLDQAQSLVYEINEKSSKGKSGFRQIGKVAEGVTQEINGLYQNQESGDVTGIPTGFVKLDRMTAGLQKGDLIIVAGRPSMGKTAFAMNIAENAGLRDGMPVAVFSMEMSAEALTKRLISSRGRIDAQKLRRGRLDDEDWGRFSQVVKDMDRASFYIDDTPGLTVNEVRSRARRLALQTGGLALIVLDYLQLMSGSGHGSSSENRATEISEISRGLKSLAKEMNVPLIALSQLNRGVDARTDKRPLMSDLRESGAIEQDADVILFIYRDEVYNKDSPDNKNRAEVIIGKQRNGPTGIVNLRFDGQFTRFDNLAEEYDIPAGQ